MVGLGCSAHGCSKHTDIKVKSASWKFVNGLTMCLMIALHCRCFKRRCVSNELCWYLTPWEWAPTVPPLSRQLKKAFKQSKLHRLYINKCNACQVPLSDSKLISWPGRDDIGLFVWFTIVTHPDFPGSLNGALQTQGLNPLFRCLLFKARSRVRQVYTAASPCCPAMFTGQFNVIHRRALDCSQFRTSHLTAHRIILQAT